MSDETCSLDDVFPLDDLSFGQKARIMDAS